MSLQKQVIDIPLGGGLQTKVDPKLVQPGQSVVLENAEFDAIGSISKRNGYTALDRNIKHVSPIDTTDTSISTGAALMEHNGELLMSNKSRLYSRLSSGWIDKGVMVPVGIKTDRVGSSIPAVASSTAAVGAIYSDCAVANGIVVYLWESNTAANGLLSITVQDLATKAIYYSGVIDATTVSTARIVATGNYIYIVKSSGANLGYFVIDTTDVKTSLQAVLTGITSLKTDGGGGYALDVAAFDSSGTAVCAYETNAVGIGVFKFNSLGVIAGGVTIAENPTDNLCVYVSSVPRVYVAWMVAANLRAITYDSALSVATAAGTVRAGTAGTNNIVACAASNGDILLFYQWEATLGGLTYRILGASRLNPIGTVGTAGVALAYGGHVNIMSKPFLVNSTVFILLGYTALHKTATSVQPTYFLCAYDKTIDAFTADTGQLKAIARIMPGEGITEERITATKMPRPSSVYADGSGGYLTSVPALFSQNLVLDSASPQPGVASIAMDFTVKSVAAVLGDNLHIASGQLYEYDGRKVTENNFNLYPEVALAEDNGSGSLADGTYGVAIVFGQFDAHGQIILSAPSVVTAVATSGGSSQILVTTRDPRMTLKEYYMMMFYLTEVGGSIYYEAAVETNVGDGSFTTHALATTSGLTDNRILYTTGGVLDNAAPPALQSVVAKGKRLYGITSEGVLWYTKARLAGEAAAFSEELTVDFGGDGGSSYALAVMDDAIFVFGENKIRVISGDGPDDTGLENNLTDPRDIASPVGRLAGTPVVATSEGIYFRAPNGIWRLSRSLTVEYVGAPVESYSGLTMTSAVVVPEKSQVRFGHSDGSTLVYDYVAQQWSVFTNHSGVDAAVWDDDYCWLKSDGTVYQQSTGFVDDASSINMVVETPWIRVGALGGVQRVNMLEIVGEWRSAHTLTAKIYIDHDGSVISETVTWDLSTGYASGQPLRVRHRLGHQCGAIKVRIEDSSQAGTKESCTLAMLTLEVSGKGGTYRTGTAQTG